MQNTANAVPGYKDSLFLKKTALAIRATNDNVVSTVPLRMRPALISSVSICCIYVFVVWFPWACFPFLLLIILHSWNQTGISSRHALWG